MDEHKEELEVPELIAYGESSLESTLGSHDKEFFAYYIVPLYSI